MTEPEVKFISDTDTLVWSFYLLPLKKSKLLNKCSIQSQFVKKIEGKVSLLMLTPLAS